MKISLLNLTIQIVLKAIKTNILAFLYNCFLLKKFRIWYVLNFLAQKKHSLKGTGLKLHEDKISQGQKLHELHFCTRVKNTGKKN